jgi:hypothetical protein
MIQQQIAILASHSSVMNHFSAVLPNSDADDLESSEIKLLGQSNGNYLHKKGYLERLP